MEGPIIAIRMKKPNRTAPTLAFVGRRRQIPARAYALRGPGTGWYLPAGALPSSVPCSSAGVDSDVNDVDDEVGEQDGEGDDEEDRLHQRVVVGRHGV